MPTIPNQQSANDSVIVRVPVPQPVQNTQRKPRQPQQNTQTQQSTFKKTTSNTPQSIILPYFPAVGNEQKTAGNATQINNAATQYSKDDAPKINYNKSIRRKLKNILRWKKITLSNPGLCTYSREDDQWFSSKTKNVEDHLQHLIHADHLEEQGKFGTAKHIRDTVEKGDIQYRVIPDSLHQAYLNSEAQKKPYNFYTHFDGQGIVVQHRHVDEKGNRHIISYNIQGLDKEDVKNRLKDLYSELDDPFDYQRNGRKINYNKEKAPTGGIINRGMYFPGGSFIPDMPSGLPNDNSSLPTSEVQPQVSKKKKLLTDIKDILKSHKSQLPINDKVLYEKYRGPSYVPRKDEQWYDEDWHTVTSSNVQSVAYNPTFKRLYVEFKRKKGGHSVYQYENVPDDIHDALMQASSKGKFVYYVLRNHGTDSDYSYRQID